MNLNPFSVQLRLFLTGYSKDFYFDYWTYIEETAKKEMWPLNERVIYVQIQADKPVYSDSSLDKLFCLTNRKSGNQLWQLESVHEIYIFLRGYVSFIDITTFVHSELMIIFRTGYSIDPRP